MKFNEDVSFRVFAQWWLSEREEKLRRGEISAATHDAHHRAVTRLLLPTLRDIAIRDVSATTLHALREATTHVPAAGNEALALVRRMLARAEKLGLRPAGTNPAAAVRPHVASATADTLAEADRVAIIRTCEAIRQGKADVCHPTLASIFLFIALTGAKPSEVRDLRWRNLDRTHGDHGAVWLQRCKSADGFREKLLVLSAEARAVIDEYDRGCSDVDAPVFPSHRRPGRPYSKLRQSWTLVAKLAGLEGLHLTALCLERASGETNSSNGRTDWRPEALCAEKRPVDMTRLTFTKDVQFGVFASAWLREREDELNSGELAPRTFLSYRRTVRGILIPALDGFTVEEIDVHLMRALRRVTSHIPAKGNQALNLARRILNVAERLGLRPPHSNPVLRVKPHPELASARPASPADVDAVVRACEAVVRGDATVCHPNIAKICHLIALTGARPSEIVTLRARNLDLTHGHHGVLRLRKHKTTRTVGEKLIVLSAAAREVIDRLGQVPNDREAPLFPSHRNPAKPYRDISKAWRRLATFAGVEGINLRDLRSGLATNAYENDVGVKDIQGMMGHKSARTTMGYIKLSSRRIGDAYEKVDAAREREMRQKMATRRPRHVTAEKGVGHA